MELIMHKKQDFDDCVCVVLVVGYSSSDKQHDR
jgi:hypothetical protein